MCIDPRISFDSLSFALLSDINICLGCGPLLSGTAAVIGLVNWSKQRHICRESLRLEVDQRKHSMLGAGMISTICHKDSPRGLAHLLLTHW